jgi:hypothetical protein
MSKNFGQGLLVPFGQREVKFEFNSAGEVISDDKILMSLHRISVTQLPLLGQIDRRGTHVPLPHPSTQASVSSITLFQRALQYCH